ncbi:hypothetical protein [Methylogaea oryzae]|uniref:Uncharacterized protein n=1 Tax=Methylogaea oryzae TaxID=1295382 RepID=A0A8D4VPQ6_9GAMM|nr:hypothetical protein [Methylogaea oryzae]BBL70399.1 hypothetical protein MoryE10_10050 [Methylogaea oryzae]
MHIFYLLVFGPLLLLLAAAALFSVMVVGAVILEFPLLILPAAALLWLAKNTSRRSQEKHVPCEQM